MTSRRVPNEDLEEADGDEHAALLAWFAVADCAVYSPPIDPASACPACGSWVGVAPEVTP